MHSNSMGRLVGYLGGLACLVAGVYLLQYQSVSDLPEGTSWFVIIGHGMGIYFIGKGLYMLRSTHTETETVDRLQQLVELSGGAKQPAKPSVEPLGFGPFKS